MQGSRPARIGDQIRAELSDLLARDVKDPGIGFITITHVKVSADLQVARAYYTLLGAPSERATTAKALDRATPYLRRQIAGRLRLRRAPELAFQFDETIERQQRIEALLQEIHAAEPQSADSSADASAEASPQTSAPSSVQSSDSSEAAPGDRRSQRDDQA